MARRRVSGIPDICNSNMKEVDASAHSRIRCFIMRQHITLLPPLSFLSSFFSFLSFFFFLSVVYFSRSVDTFIWSDPEGWSLCRERSALGWAVAAAATAVATKKEDFWYFSREQGNRTELGGKGQITAGGGRLNKEQK